MEDWLLEVKESWNKTSDSQWYQSLRTEERIKVLVENPKRAFHPAVYELIQRYIPKLKGKKVLLPSSGDNHAVFAFALMGAQVTSADISERQLENAAVIAEELGLSIEFVCENTITLEQIGDTRYDLVYTSNGTHSWIPDLEEMYGNISRVLKPGGYSMMFDMHPFQRPFTGEAWKEPQILKSYHDTLPSCHWRIQDLVNAKVKAGLSIREMAELPAVEPSFWFAYDELIKQDEESLKDINNWEKNPMAALPAWVTIVSRRENKGTE